MPPIVDIDADSVPMEEIAPTLIALASLQTRLAARLIAAKPSDSTPDMQVHPARLLTVVEVAEQLGYSPARVYEMIRQGELPAMRHGKYVRVRAAAVDAFIGAHERSSALGCVEQLASPIGNVLTSGRDRTAIQTGPPKPRTRAIGTRRTARGARHDGVALGTRNGRDSKPGGAGDGDAGQG